VVHDRYLLAKAGPPSGLQRWFGHEVVPTVIDGAASVEAVLERVAVRTRRQPAMMVGLAFGAGLLLSAATPSWRSGRHAQAACRRPALSSSGQSPS
jgi:hypothetical protein